ncbi:SDR family oxidoreductase [Qipengyuania sp. S6317L1]|uniref:SDR family NAD(P)-dependent oxidoreductase n=1 Tax=Qipengyuania sp. S6317L1 TaxID=2926410 RepID=UPI001FF5B14B|nr:SDR family oxidoreductase [Qipengyuania sp. S6317L1]MCK0099913.1 SDR family oxidoreductase [Qipengyuania sp. S6317L1]
MTNPLDFTGKSVVVIGGSSGIGNGIAHSFRKAGAEVLVTGTRPDEGDYLEAEDSDFTGLSYAQLNVSDRDAVGALVETLGPVDVLIQSQGIVRYSRGEFAREGWDDVIDVNLNSVMDVARAFHGKLAEAGGTMTVVSSVAGFKANIGNPAYSASKAGAVSLVKTLGAAWARDGIRVNGIAPGLVATKITTVTTQNPERLEGALQRIPLRRLGTPEDMAGAALFLASPLSAYITGHTLVVDGGLTLQ